MTFADINDILVSISASNEMEVVMWRVILLTVVMVMERIVRVIKAVIIIIIISLLKKNPQQ